MNFRKHFYRPDLLSFLHESWEKVKIFLHFGHIFRRRKLGMPPPRQAEREAPEGQSPSFLGFII